MIFWGWLVAAFMGGALFGLFAAAFSWISRDPERGRKESDKE